MLKNFYWALLVSALWPLLTWGKIYKYNITLKTPKSKRWWEGPESNTGRNYGGWLFRVTHFREGTFCGASYYSPLLMIVSANCIYPYRYDLDGTSVTPTFTDEDIFGLIDIVYTPSKFIYQKLYMDIALIRLRNPIKGKTTEFIKLCSTTISAGMMMTAYAWGFDSMTWEPPSTVTKNGSVPVLDIKLCQKKYKNTTTKLSSTSFCVTHPKDNNMCRYDGGAPLTYGTELCGVVSRGPLCSDTKQPGIYTNINKMIEFIEGTEKNINNGILKEPKTSRRSIKPGPNRQ
ncbi:seminase-like [Drosophila eugracilis]|uniref:seminase-like n=1 Tax=Drosophila eugracilis TaxID=29029 RepID=UPI001BD99A7E|nr:seminase-like [Drosophila eugracilis]